MEKQDAAGDRVEKGVMGGKPGASGDDLVLEMERDEDIGKRRGRQARVATVDEPQCVDPRPQDMERRSLAENTPFRPDIMSDQRLADNPRGDLSPALGQGRHAGEFIANGGVPPRGMGVEGTFRGNAQIG